MSPRLRFAIDVARRAGDATLDFFQQGTTVDLKADDSPVTAADRLAERMIRSEIEKSFPDDGILGEEEGAKGDVGSRWVIDPIDGTKSFVAGVPLYATLLSYEVDEEPVLGVCYFPALKELLYAEKGAGAYWNDQPCRVNSNASLDGGIVSSGSMSSMRKYGRIEGYLRVEQRALACRTWSDAYGHALVATGRIDAMIDPVIAHWDISAMSLIVREAGGRFTDFEGRDVLGKDALSSNGRVHDDFVEAFRA